MISYQQCVEKLANIKNPGPARPDFVDGSGACGVVTQSAERRTCNQESAWAPAGFFFIKGSANYESGDESPPAGSRDGASRRQVIKIMHKISSTKRFTVIIY